MGKRKTFSSKKYYQNVVFKEVSREVLKNHKHI